LSEALLALHYQNEVLHPDGKIRVGMAKDDPARVAVITAAKRLIGGARRAKVPVVSVRIAFRPDYKDVIRNCPIFRNVVKLGAMAEGSWGAEFHDGLGPEAGELVVKHGRVNAFYGSPLEEVLRVLGATRLAIAGVATNSVVEHTARHAADMGFEVTVASDACSSGDRGLHEASLRNLALVADIRTTAQIVAAWRRRANSRERT
jgi:nicotinamidase-related amidase